jgi:DNA helicase-2/ATP-dependent DNA helicase PcrA
MPEPPQHGVIKALASRMPVCIFGDPLQAIFDFKGQKPVDWDSEVFPTFAKLGKLTTPWRWRKSKNLNLANWLEATRIVLENGGAIDLKGRPDCVEWKQVSTTENERRKTITGACKALLGSLGDDTLIVIGDPININARALLGKQLASAGFSRIEPINCKSLYVTATKLDKSKGLSRLDAH